MSRLGDLSDGEREAFSHGSGSRDDDHLVCLENYAHTPYLVCHCRRKLVDSLPWGIPTVVVYLQTRCASYELDGDARHRKGFLSRFSRRVGVIPTSCV